MINYVGPLVLHMPPDHYAELRPYRQTLGRSGILVRRTPVRPGAQITVMWKRGEPPPTQRRPMRIA